MNYYYSLYIYTNAKAFIIVSLARLTYKCLWKRLKFHFSLDSLFAIIEIPLNSTARTHTHAHTRTHTRTHAIHIGMCTHDRYTCAT